MWSGSRTEFCFCGPLCQLYRICRVDAEKDDQDLSLLDSAVYPFEAVMFLLGSEGSLHRSGTYTGKFLFDGTDRGCGFPLSAFLRERCLNAPPAAEGAVLIAGVTAVTAKSGDFLPEEFLGQFHTVYETGALVECVEGKLFDERYAVNLDLLHLAPNSTFFISLPLTIGRTYGLLTLTIRLGMLSLALPLS